MTEEEKAARAYAHKRAQSVDLIHFDSKQAEAEHAPYRDFMRGVEWCKKHLLEKLRGCVEEIKIHHEGFKGEWDESKDMVELSDIEELCK